MFVYVLVKFVLYLWKQNLKITPVNYRRYLVLYRLPPIKCPGYDIKPSDGKASVLELSRMWNTPSLPMACRGSI